MLPESPHVDDLPRVLGESPKTEEKPQLQAAPEGLVSITRHSWDSAVMPIVTGHLCALAPASLTTVIGMARGSDLPDRWASTGLLIISGKKAELAHTGQSGSDTPARSGKQTIERQITNTKADCLKRSVHLIKLYLY